MSMDSTQDRSASRLTSIQVLRGVAASIVVLHHFAQAVQLYAPRPALIVQSGLGELGAAGVDLFFVLSGFIMVYTTKNRLGPRDALDFLDKRARRVFPLYWVWTTAILVMWVGGIALRSHHYPFPFIVASYLLVPMFNEDSFHPLLNQGWTLLFEMLFYLAFASAMCFSRGIKRICVIALLLAVLSAASQLLPASMALRAVLSHSLLLEFVYGMLAAELVLRSHTQQASRWRRALPLIATTVGALLLLSTAVLEPDVYPRGLVWGIPCFLIVLGTALLPGTPRRGLFGYLGDASYSIYLTHGFFTLAFGMALQKVGFLRAAHPDALILVCTISTILLTSVSYLLVEKPLTKWLSRPSVRPRTEAALGSSMLRSRAEEPRGSAVVPHADEPRASTER